MRTRKDGCCGPSSRAAGGRQRRRPLKIHPNEQSLEELLLALDDRQRSVVRHLGWCGTSRSKLVYLPRPHPPEKDASAGQESAALAESRRAVSEWQAAMEKERDDAPG